MRGRTQLTIGELTTHIGSGATPRGGAQAYCTSGVPFIRSQNVRDGRLELSGIAFIAADTHASMRRSSVNPGDVLLNITGASIGRSCVVPSGLEEANVNQHVCILRSNGKVIPAFLHAMLEQPETQQSIREIAAGGSREGLNYQQVASLAIPWFPVEQQHSITTLYTCFQNARAALDALVDAKRALKRALLHELLTGRRRFPEFASREWQVAPLGDLVATRAGKTPSREVASYWNGTTPWVTAKDLKSLRLRDSQDRVTDAALTSGAPIAQPGDVLVLVRGMMLMKRVPVGLVERPLTFNQDIRQLRPTSQIRGDFLAYSLLLAEEKVLAMVSQAGHGTGRLEVERLMALEINVPCKEEQGRIAGTLEAADREIALLEQLRDTYETQKRALMQSLLSGDLPLPTPTSRPDLAHA